MVLESDKTTEARRKAMRNGEEDPLIVAQRFLNIYRQMHIFSPERKDAFNKMLLELSPEIRGLFSSLPGGIMLQDYVDDLAEKNGVQKSIHPAASPKLNEEAHQQAQILATALAQAQTQARPQMPPQAEYTAPSSGVVGTANLTMDKDFAGEFARIIGGVMEQQTLLQKESLEKLSENLTKTQLFIAQSIKESQGTQKSDDIKEICRVIIEVYKRAKEDQEANIGEICKTIAQGQTASIPAENTVRHDEAAQRLIEVVLDGQKQLNSRLSKVEELSLSRANDNKELLAIFEKSQSEMIKSLKEIQGKEVVSSGNEEKLAKLIGESQEKLIHTILAANIQQNASASQANNNANNIQINTADNSAQMLLLIDKIASLQAANEQNLEKAISKILEAQSGVYDKISRRQTEELAQIIAKSFTEAKQPVQVHIQDNTIEKAELPEPKEVLDDETIEPEALPEKMPWEEPAAVELPVKEPRKKKKKKKKREVVEQKPIEDSQEDNPFDKENFSIDDLPNIEDLLPDETKEAFEPSDWKFDEPAPADELSVSEAEPVSEMEEEHRSESPVEKMPQPDASGEPEQEPEYHEEQEEPEENFEPSEKAHELSGDDWGFGTVSSKTPEIEPVEDNDNGEGTEWTWAYKPDSTEDNLAEEDDAVEAIGENSYIYSSSLFDQEQVVNGGASIYGSIPEKLSLRPKIIGMSKPETEDPYQNSILKD